MKKTINWSWWEWRRRRRRRRGECQGIRQWQWAFPQRGIEAGEVVTEKKKTEWWWGGDGGKCGDDDIDTVPGEIPIDILRKMSPICEKMGITMRQQLGLTMGFVELCGELKYTCYFIQMTFYDWHCNRSGLNQTYNEPRNSLASQAI